MRRSRPGSEYPLDWNDIAKSTKDAAGWCCVRCGVPHQKGHVLTVHHLDMDPSNCAWWNLAALCQQCHLTIQAKVVMERIWFLPHSDWFKPYVAGYTAHRLGMDDSRQYVIDHLQELLELCKA